MTTPHPLVDIAARAIAAHGLLPQQDRPVLVALSGGADSVALLSVLCELGYVCVAAHCNFHLRGAESDSDARLCQSICARLGVDLYVRDCDVDARRRATGESVEMACRELRYAWFDSLLDNLRAQAVAVAHHREDNVETMLLNLARGSSITGVAAMRPRHGMVIRPLLQASRAQIEDYLSARGLPFAIDSTNAQNDYTRNRLRNVVLPALYAALPAAKQGLLRSLEHLSANRDFYAAAMRERVERYSSPGRVLLAQMLEQEEHARLILFETLHPMGFNISQVDNILAYASGSGQRFCSDSYTLTLHGGELHISPRGAAPAPGEVEVSLRRDILAPVHISVRSIPVAEFRPERDPDKAYFDEAMLQGEPRFTIRPWRRGDRFRPFGMNGTRLVSDLISDAKLTPRQKQDLRLLTRDDEILWVIGHRAAAPYAVTPATRRVLILQHHHS